MTGQWVVLLTTGIDEKYAYGPLDGKTAREFAEFLTAEVDPARAVELDSPTGELTAWWRAQKAKAGTGNDTERPDDWPPKPGDVWEDRNGDRWICTRMPSDTPYLVCIAKQADDPADEIWRRYGPLRRWMRFEPNANTEEPPF